MAGLAITTTPLPKPAKRARTHFERDALLTPQPSSDNGDASHKLPNRLVSGPLTPSTSTVAFSSSPRLAAFASSSPTRQKSSVRASTDSVDIELKLRAGTTFIFGRHHVRDAATKPSTTISSAVPRSLSHLVANPDSVVDTITLPRAAHHASRVHALVELVIPLSQTKDKVMRILAIGQNGLRVKTNVPSQDRKKKGLRLVSGRMFEVPFSKGQSVELDFYGAKAVVRMEGEVEEEQDDEVLFPASPVRQSHSLPSSMPPSSPPLLPLDASNDVDEDMEMPAVGDEEKEASSRESSPLSPVSNCSGLRSPSPSHLSSPALASSPAVAPEHDERHNDVDVKRELIDHALQKEPDLSISRKHTPAQSRPLTPEVEVPRKAAPADVDRPAVIAATVVFSGSSKLSLPDLVKHMLEAQPHLKKHGNENDWMDWVGEELESNPMFGKVDRHGKDSSGHPLLPHYFYNPTSDPDAQRAKDLGGLVRPLRTAARGGQAIDWRPVGRKRKVVGW